MSDLITAIRAALPDETLRERMRARAILHLPGALGAVRSVYSLDMLGAALARRAIPADHVSFYLANRKIDLEKVQAVSDGVLRPAALRTLALQGGTLVVRHLETADPEIHGLVCEAERWLQGPVLAGLVASFGASALPLHYDGEDLLIVQLAGAKLWHFHGDPEPACALPSESDPGTPEPPLAHAVMMRQGDLLYVPCGQRHRCVPQGDSLHLGLLIRNAPASRIFDDPLLTAPVQRFSGIESLPEAARRRSDLWAARRAHMLHLDLETPDPDAPGAFAIWNLSLPPAITNEGKLVAGRTSMTATPAILALIDNLRDGPQPAASLDRAALNALAAAGFVRIRR
ncbi:cupin domain-containing protein [Sphingomonas sp. G-3-2-10]|uniref:JmjC domain-containing protein n=1 Tax=Sphingomonas sp. G-3-2-10 TaxID=2728838 RepID=UPI00146DB0D1|nr:cupin domain-containing protein [Sphingomonas sp. G-3-2-10]NML06894.1 hypothetical protein [Sphingomonas sp. G-3-2-10]